MSLIERKEVGHSTGGLARGGGTLRTCRSEVDLANVSHGVHLRIPAHVQLPSACRRPDFRPDRPLSMASRADDPLRQTTPWAAACRGSRSRRRASQRPVYRAPASGRGASAPGTLACQTALGRGVALSRGCSRLKRGVARSPSPRASAWNGWLISTVCLCLRRTQPRASQRREPSTALGKPSVSAAADDRFAQFDVFGLTTALATKQS